MTWDLLVVVDMQHYWVASRSHKVQSGVASLVREARKRGRFVVFLEYGKGGTYPWILEGVRGYSRHAVARKKGMDGSRQVLEACREHDVQSGHVWVCGVDTQCCVTATVRGLRRLLPDSRMRVVLRACNTKFHGKPASIERVRWA